MQRYKALDPACGSGNFLYIAYRELKRLEAGLLERIREQGRTEKRQRQIGFVTAQQFFGIDINPFAIEIAKVTMMIARKLAIDEFKTNERALPLDNLDDNFIAGDALIEEVKVGGKVVRHTLFEQTPEEAFSSGQLHPTRWPAADVIIGNPPFLGAKRLNPERGGTYVNAVRKTYVHVPKMADYCVYRLRKAHDHLPLCTAADPVAGRAGLVGTQNIRNNQSRVGGLDHIVTSGTIVEAVDNQPWSGDANVHVSIVNWVKHDVTKSRSRSVRLEAPVDPHGRSDPANPVRQRATIPLIPVRKRLWYRVPSRLPLQRMAAQSNDSLGMSPLAVRRADKRFELAFREPFSINSSLSDDVNVAGAHTLSCNTDAQRSFQGVAPGYKGFVISLDKRRAFVRNQPSITRLASYSPTRIGSGSLRSARS